MIGTLPAWYAARRQGRIMSAANQYAKGAVIATAVGVDALTVAAETRPLPERALVQGGDAKGRPGAMLHLRVRAADRQLPARKAALPAPPENAAGRRKPPCWARSAAT